MATCKTSLRWLPPCCLLFKGAPLRLLRFSLLKALAAPTHLATFLHKALTGHGSPAEVLTHCRRELMHAIWHLLLDDEFLEVYEHGIGIECEDGIFRRFYPRIFTYSADYPEKYVLMRSHSGLDSCL